MLARRVLLKERFHYANGKTFINGTAALRASSANAWTVTNNGSGVPYITSPAAGTYRNLMNTRTHPVTSAMVYEFHCKASAWNGTNNGTNGFGMLIQADAPAGSTGQEYRFRQVADKLHLERYNGSWTSNASWALGAVAGSDYYYRIFYSQSGHSIYNWASPFTAGAFYIYRGQTEAAMSYVGTYTDPSPLTNGSYIGLFKGSGSTIVSSHMGVYNLFELDATATTWTHEVDTDSTAVIELSRDPDRLITTNTVNDRWEIWAPESNASTGVDYLYLVFDGSLERGAEGRQRVIQLEGWSREMKDLHWFNGSGYTETNSTTLSRQLATGGGQMSCAVTPSVTSTYVLHSAGVDVAMSDEIDKAIQGKNMDVTFRQLLKESRGFYFYHPDGRFWVRRTLVTGPRVIDTTNSYLPILGYEIWKDGRQVVNTNEGYYNGYTSPNTTQNATSQGVYGVRDRGNVDMLQNSNTGMGRAEMTYVDQYSRNDYVFKVDLANWGFDLFPGMAVTVKLAGTLFGTNNGSSDTDTWSAEKCTLFKTHYSSDTGIHSLYMTYNGTLGDATMPVVVRYPTDVGGGQDMARMLKHILSQVT